VGAPHSSSSVLAPRGSWRSTGRQARFAGSGRQPTHRALTTPASGAADSYPLGGNSPLHTLAPLLPICYIYIQQGHLRNGRHDIMQHTYDIHGLLVEATHKLIALRQLPEWRSELPGRCPPILWFGDAASKKQRVLTIGANPSRQEYLAESSQKAAAKIQNYGNDTQLFYLEPPRNRFYVLQTTSVLDEIAVNNRLQTDIINGYNGYFKQNPYRWFGKDKANSYNVEGFLRGIGASYFSHTLTYQAIHVDLFPFATIRDFNQIRSISERDIFQNGWARAFLTKLIDMLQPEIIIIFGRTNVAHYTNYISPILSNTVWQRHSPASFCIGRDTTRNTPIIGLSANLGNPKGFTAQGLFSFGNAVKSALG
jgi:hypothetical protein